MPRRREFVAQLTAAAAAAALAFDPEEMRAGTVSASTGAWDTSWRRLASTSGQPVDVVQKDLRANLIPGAILVPSGIYALIRAQNAGCAYMPGT